MLRSAKPITASLKDAIIFSIAIVIVYIISYTVYYTIHDGNLNGLFTADSLKFFAKVFVSMIAWQFAYEYSGYNASVAESSIRHAKGSQLSKFTTRRHAMLYEAYDSVIADMIPENSIIKMNDNRAVLMFAIENPNIISKIVDIDNSGKPTSLDDIKAKIKEDITDGEFALIMQLPRETRALLPQIINDADADIMRDILINGFADYRAEDRDCNGAPIDKILEFARVNARINNDKIIAVKRDALARKENDIANLSARKIALKYGDKRSLLKNIENNKKDIERAEINNKKCKPRGDSNLL